MLYTRVQAWTDATAAEGDASITKTYGVTPTQGNLLVAAGSSSQSHADATITGWTKAVGIYLCAIFYKIAGAGESTNVTLDVTSATVTSLSIAEYAAVDAVTPLDVTASSDQNGLETSHASGTTADTALGGSLAVAAFSFGVHTSNAVAFTFTNGFVGQTGHTGGDGDTMLTVATKLVAVGAHTTTMTFPSAFCGGVIAVFRPEIRRPSAQQIRFMP